MKSVITGWMFVGISVFVYGRSCMLLCSHADVRKCAPGALFHMIFQVLFMNCESLLLAL